MRCCAVSSVSVTLTAEAHSRADEQDPSVLAHALQGSVAMEHTPRKQRRVPGYTRLSRRRSLTECRRVLGRSLCRTRNTNYCYQGKRLRCHRSTVEGGERLHCVSGFVLGTSCQPKLRQACLQAENCQAASAFHMASRPETRRAEVHECQSRSSFGPECERSTFVGGRGRYVGKGCRQNGWAGCQKRSVRHARRRGPADSTLARSPVKR